MSEQDRRPTTRIREQVRRLLKLGEAQVALGWGVVLVLAAVLGTIYLAQASSVAEVGRRVQLLQLELEDVKRQNAALEREIAAAQSLERLQQRALALGFFLADPEDIDYVIVADYPAGAEIAVEPEATPTPREEPIDTIQTALWVALTKSFSNLTRGESVEQ